MKALRAVAYLYQAFCDGKNKYFFTQFSNVANDDNTFEGIARWFEKGYELFFVNTFQWPVKEQDRSLGNGERIKQMRTMVLLDNFWENEKKKT